MPVPGFASETGLGELVDATASSTLEALAVLFILTEAVADVVDSGELPEGYAKVANAFIENIKVLTEVELLLDLVKVPEENEESDQDSVDDEVVGDPDL